MEAGGSHVWLGALPSAHGNQSYISWYTDLYISVWGPDWLRWCFLVQQYPAETCHDSVALYTSQIILGNWKRNLCPSVKSHAFTYARWNGKKLIPRYTLVARLTYSQYGALRGSAWWLADFLFFLSQILEKWGFWCWGYANWCTISFILSGCFCEVFGMFGLLYFRYVVSLVLLGVSRSWSHWGGIAKSSMFLGLARCLINMMGQHSAT